MSNPQIQMDLLSEDRDPLETLNYAITREIGQENQQRISNTHLLNPNGSGINLIQRQQTQRRSILPTPPNNNKIPDCWKCGNKFIKGHLDNCPAKYVVGNICKKVGHYAKLCRSEIPPRRVEIQNTQKTTKFHTPTEINSKITHNNKQIQDEYATHKYPLITTQSMRKKRQAQKQSIPKAHVASEK